MLLWVLEPTYSCLKYVCYSNICTILGSHFCFVFCMSKSFKLHNGDYCWHIAETLDFIVFIWRVVIFVLSGSSVIGRSPWICAELVLHFVRICAKLISVASPFQAPWPWQDSNSKTMSSPQILSRVLSGLPIAYIFYFIIFGCIKS